VLLHGLGGDHTVWNGLLPDLSPSLRVLAPDLRGHGRSPAPEGSTYRFEEMEADVLAYLDRADLPRAHFVGMSAGGFLALRLALDHPERIGSLTMVGSGLYCDSHTRAVGERWAEVLRDDGYEAYAVRLMKDLYYPDWAEEHLDLLDRFREAWRHRDLGGVVRWAFEIRRFDERPRVARLAAPTLVVHGMDDQVVDVAHARLTRQSIRGCEVRLLARTGHMVPVERPQETAEALLGWVAKVEGRPRGEASGD
jgi:pimeloyl-ACP methyl ester carboxylesterase